LTKLQTFIKIKNLTFFSTLKADGELLGEMPIAFADLIERNFKISFYFLFN
jgi:hypothetical protein